MQVNYSFDENDLYFYLDGELDEHYAKGVKDYLDGVIEGYNGLKSVIFDMSKLSFMDSTGIGILLGRYKRLKKRGVECFIENPTVSVERVLELSGIYEVIKKL